MDYKSSPKKLEPLKVAAGLQLQLLAYLNVLRASANPSPVGRDSVEPHLERSEASVASISGHTTPSQATRFARASFVGSQGSTESHPTSLAPPFTPVGVFYIPLHGAAAATGDRAEILAEDEAARRATYQHAGRFDFPHRPHLDDRANAQPSGQFRYTLNQDGALSKRPGDALPPADFTALLTQVEDNLRRLGEAIFAGEVTVAPVRLSASDNACARCDYRPICRFDPWTQPYRTLPKPGARTPTSAADAPPPAA